MAVAIVAFVPPLLPEAMSAITAGAITGGLAGLVTTGSIKGKLIGAATGAAFGGIGNAFSQSGGLAG